MEKVYIKDKQGNKVLPKTHVSAVYDDEGNDLGSHLGAFEDEVRGLVDTPHQEYVTVATYASLPASGSEDTIYRVSNYNGSTSQVNASVYSEYAWDGTQYVFLCVKSAVGEVFDITVYNNNTKYANLSAALGVDGANIPQSLRKGGMSVKYVQSSDNKYVQYFCNSQTFTTDVSYWEKMNLEKEVSHLDQCINENAYKAGKNKFNKNSPGCVIGRGYYGDGWFNGGFNTSDYIPVSPGEKYVFSDNGASCQIRWITFFDSNKDYISESVLQSQTSITIPSGASYVRLAPSNTHWDTLQIEEGNIITSFEEYRVEYNGEYMAKDSIPIDRLQLVPGINLFNPNSGGVLIDTMVYGSTVSSVSGLNTTDYIPVVEGKNYSFFSALGYSMRFITFYDINKAPISYLSSQNSVTTPANTKYVRITISNNTWSKCSFALGCVNSNYIPFNKTISGEYIKSDLFCGAKYGGIITNTETLYFLNQHISKNFCLTLMAIGTISDISFGVGKNADGGTFVNLTTTQIVVYHIDGPTQVVATYNHGLTLTDRTYLHINEKDDRSAEITLCSGGEQYIVESVEWRGRGQVFLSNNNGASMDFEISVMPSDLCKAIWIFGDSYYSHDVENRHLYYIYSLGYKNFLLNNKGGIASMLSYADFENILSFGHTPKYALWGLGMNDGSDTDEDTPNSGWLSYIQKFINTCLERKIIPILATIPSAYDSISRVLYYHDGKSKWVRNSGFRYIDYAKAVDSDAEGQWGDGYKGVDVHPTAKGARMLANQLLLDFPEIGIGDM